MLRRLILPLLVALPLAAGCKQGVGDRCQLDSDCDSKNCVLPAGGTRAQGGVCGAAGTGTDGGGVVTTDLAGPAGDGKMPSTDGSTADATAPVDAPASEDAAAPDLGMGPDMATPPPAVDMTTAPTPDLLALPDSSLPVG